MHKSIVFEVIDQTLLITMSRPNVKNAITLEMAEEIARGMEWLDNDPELRVGVITGDGGNFSSGMDLREFQRTGQKPSMFGKGFAGFVEAPPRKPLIAAVEGYALGGGFEMVLACDMVVGSRDAVFGLPEALAGLTAFAGLVRLPNRIPRVLAMEALLTGNRITAASADDSGLLNRLVDPGTAVDSAIGLAGEVIKGAPQAVDFSKLMVNAGPLHENPSTWESIREEVAEIAGSQDAKEGARAFSEKRAPIWQGMS